MSMKEYMDIYVIWWVVGLCFLLVGHGVEVEASHPRCKNLQSLPEEQPYRTAFHFQPPQNWMNDPNDSIEASAMAYHNFHKALAIAYHNSNIDPSITAPMFYKEVYHLFYQYNPYGAAWANIVWAHSISYDLVNWVHLEHAISPADPYDINGCWSGSATFLPGGEPAILYTGIHFENREVQNLAFPKNASDPLLREWVKSPRNPLMSPSDGIGARFFRDPTTAWQGQDKVWRVLVGSQINGHGTAILYRSKDFINWSRSPSPLHSSEKTGMWECPDFYPVSINGTNGVDTSTQDDVTRHVLKASFNVHDYYIIGKYVPITDSYIVETDFMDAAGSDLRYDYGKFYASKTFFDSAKKRRIVWAWINESESESDDLKKGWSGLQSIPRNILLSTTGKQLVLWPIEEIEKLRGSQVNFDSRKLKGGSNFEVPNITAAQADIDVSFDLPKLDKAELMDSSWVDPQLLCSQKNASVKGNVGPFGLLVLASEDLKEQTAIFFRVFKSRDKYVVLMCSDQSRSSLREEVDKTTYGAFIDIDPRHEKISLRSLIDHSIVESFGGEGKACITARVYPKLAINKAAHLYVFNSGTQSVRVSKLSAWSMKKAQMVATVNDSSNTSADESSFLPNQSSSATIMDHDPRQSWCMIQDNHDA